MQSLKSAPAFRHIHFPKVESTNSVALDYAANGDPGHLWITAGLQTQGRGRRGRRWISEPGNLHASLLLIDPQPQERIGLLPIIAGNALYDAIAPHVEDTSALKLKWPNDLLLGGKKLSGILLEATTGENGAQHVVIGCGVNCAHHPEDGLYPATSLSAEGVDIAWERIFDDLGHTFAVYLGQWALLEGQARAAETFMKRAAGLNEPITVRYEDSVEEGAFAGLDGEGYLLLKQGDVTRRIMAGDVFLKRNSDT